MTGSTARVTFSGPNRLVSIWARKSSGADLLEEAGVEVAGVVDQHVDPAEPLDGGVDGGLRAGGVGDVERDGQQVVVRTDRGADPLGVAAGGHDRVPGGQGRPGDVHAHAAAGAGDEPDLLLTHAMHSFGVVGGEGVDLAGTQGTRVGGGVAEPGDRGYRQGPPQRPDDDLAWFSWTTGRTCASSWPPGGPRSRPQQAGLPTYGGHRRVPGLRREEVALLAGVSVEYYTRLERGNAQGVSDSVLEALVRALQLDEAERAHLFDLARAATATGRARAVGPPSSGSARACSSSSTR